MPLADIALAAGEQKSSRSATALQAIWSLVADRESDLVERNLLRWNDVVCGMASRSGWLAMCKRRTSERFNRELGRPRQGNQPG